MNRRRRTSNVAPEQPCFSMAALLVDLRRHPELDLETLTHHLNQSDAIAAEGYWHAAVNEARSFLEALLVTLLHAVRPDAPDKLNDIATTNGTPFRCYRRSLLEAGFLGADENELLHYVYGVASAKGSHHGVTSEIWCRLARRMVFITGQYVIQHYAAWKSPTPGAAQRIRAAKRDSPAPPRVPPNSPWRRLLSALTRLFTRDVL